MRIPFTKLFIGSEEINFDLFVFSKILDDKEIPIFYGVVYPDGHVYVVDGTTEFSALRHAYTNNDARFHALFPDGTVEIGILNREVEYLGTRVPEAYSVAVDTVWLDYDADRNALYVYKTRRLAFETVDEFEARRYNVVPSHVIEMDVATYQLLYSFNGKVHHTYALQPEELLA